MVSLLPWLTLMFFRKVQLLDEQQMLSLLQTLLLKWP
jgi:hypothetical protein